MIRRTAFIHAALLAAFLLMTGVGCTPKKAPGLVLDSPKAAWKVFRDNYCQPTKAPAMLVKSSLYYTRVKPRKRTNRTLVSMWGNFDGPMRLDISAGVGKLLAHIREDKNGLLVFYPSDKAAYAHVNPVLGATRLGMPFPFSLTELARAAVGDFSGLAPKRYVNGTRVKGGFRYEVTGALVTSITLDEIGRPMELAGVANKQHAARSWTLSLDKYQEETKTAPLPDRLTLAMDNGEKGVLRIKSRELKMADWPAKATGLELPEDVVQHRLDNGYTNAEHNDIPVVYEDEQ